MRKASDLADQEPHRSSPSASRTSTQPYHLRFVDPDIVDQPVNDDDAFDTDLDNASYDHSSDHDAVEDLLSTPRYVDAKALKKSTRAEIERITRERRGERFADYAFANAPARKSKRDFIWTSLVLLALMMASVGLGAVYAPDMFDRLTTKLLIAPAGVFAAIKTRIAGNGAPDTSSTDTASESKNAMPVAQGVTTKPATPSPVSQARPAVTPQAAPAQQQSVADPQSGTSPLAKSLFELGALSCIARANQISKFLSNGSEAIVLQKPVGNADRSLLLATMLPSTPDKNQGVSIVSLSPNPSIGCDGNYQSIRVIEKPCPNAVAEMFGGAKALTAGTSGITIVPLNQFGRVFAIPAGNTCVMIKQELVQ